MKLLRPTMPMLRASLPMLQGTIENPDWAERQRMYSSARWRNARLRYLKQSPRCVVCGAAANTVDHLLGHARADWRESFWDSTTWQSLCKTCHSRKTNSEERGVARHGQHGDRARKPSSQWDGSC